MSKQHHIREVLSKHAVIPVVTFHSVDEVEPMVSKLMNDGIMCIEITLRTEAAWECIAHCKQIAPSNFSVGIGTIISTEQIQKAVELQVDFMVSPGMSDHLKEAFEASNIAFIPGVATPSEMIKLMGYGWDTFKFFPAHLFGGLEALKAYGQVFPSVKFCPTGGITAETKDQYLALPNIISVGGSWMTK
jgi:2-dehydro-3-deoxyphosphogluconate aldolase/(4S)-4-hydroxy-2-oxoglutarate aldolase